MDADDAGSDALSRARSAAIRELAEETGLSAQSDSLLQFSRWLTPEVVRHRFDTYFFLAPQSPAAAVQVDGGEIVEHRWVRPEDAVAEQAAGALKIPPPTLVSLTDLVGHDSVAGLVAAVEKRSPPYFSPELPSWGMIMFLYPGDSGYEASDPAQVAVNTELRCGTVGSVTDGILAGRIGTDRRQAVNACCHLPAEIFQQLVVSRSDVTALQAV